MNEMFKVVETHYKNEKLIIASCFVTCLLLTNHDLEFPHQLCVNMRTVSHCIALTDAAASYGHMDSRHSN